MSNIIDITHRLPPPDPSNIPSASWRAAAYYRAICGAGSLAPVDEAIHTALRCRRRPRHRLCPGHLDVLRLANEPDHINWHCPSCGDHGTVHGWRGSESDLSQGTTLVSDPFDQCTVYLDEDENQLVQSLFATDDAIERVLLGGRWTERGVQLTANGLEMENLLGFVSFEANHERQRRRQARLDQICSHLERALQR